MVYYFLHLQYIKRIINGVVTAFVMINISNPPKTPAPASVEQYSRNVDFPQIEAMRPLLF